MNNVTEKMNFDGFTVISLHGDALEDNQEFAFVEDDCEAFIAKCQALEVKCLFVRKRIFSQDDFILELEGYSDDGDAENNKEQNVATLDTSINEFKQYWGTVSAISVTAIIHGERVTKILKESWFQSFENKKGEVIRHLDEVRQQTEDDLHEEMEKDELEYEKKKENLVAEMWKLINNQEFCRILTQKAKLEFAIEKIKGLNDIDYDDLKKEMQQINARIVARGLHKR